MECEIRSRETIHELELVHQINRILLAEVHITKRLSSIYRRCIRGASSSELAMLSTI